MTSAPKTYLEAGDVPAFKEKCHEPLTSADDRRDGAARIGANLTVVAMGVLAVVTEYAPARSTRFGMTGPLGLFARGLRRALSWSCRPVATFVSLRHGCVPLICKA